MRGIVGFAAVLLTIGTSVLIAKNNMKYGVVVHPGTTEGTQPSPLVSKVVLADKPILGVAPVFPPRSKSANSSKPEGSVDQPIVATPAKLPADTNKLLPDNEFDLGSLPCTNPNIVKTCPWKPAIRKLQASHQRLQKVMRKTSQKLVSRGARKFQEMHTTLRQWGNNVRTALAEAKASEQPAEQPPVPPRHVISLSEELACPVENQACPASPAKIAPSKETPAVGKDQKSPKKGSWKIEIQITIKFVPDDRESAREVLSQNAENRPSEARIMPRADDPPLAIVEEQPRQMPRANDNLAEVNVPEMPRVEEAVMVVEPCVMPLATEAPPCPANVARLPSPTFEIAEEATPAQLILKLAEEATSPSKDRDIDRETLKESVFPLCFGEFEEVAPPAWRCIPCDISSMKQIASEKRNR